MPDNQRSHTYEKAEVSVYETDGSTKFPCTIDSEGSIRLNGCLIAAIDIYDGWAQLLLYDADQSDPIDIGNIERPDNKDGYPINFAVPEWSKQQSIRAAVGQINDVLENNKHLSPCTVEGLRLAIALLHAGDNRTPTG